MERFGPEFGYTNTYVVGTPRRGLVVVVDPARGSRSWIDRTLRERKATAAAVLLTHGHMDHTWDAVELSDELEIPVMLAGSGHHLLESPERGLPRTFPMELLREHPHRRPDRLVDPGPSMAVGEMTIRAVPTPGHTPCSVTYVIEHGSEVLLCTGDTILGGGRDGSPVPPGGNPIHLQDSVRRLRRRWMNDGVVLPGHGTPFVAS